jgi:putative ABC transport system substrate-binding protein
MKRREFITLLGGTAAAWPLAVRAQQPGERVRRLALFMNLPQDDAEAERSLTAFRESLAALGWISTIDGPQPTRAASASPLPSS